MHSHIAILDSKNRPLTLKPDTSINITDKNPMFNDVEMFSQPIPLPFEQNRHLLGNMDDRDSTARANDIRGERFRILVDGLPLRNTAIKVQEGTLLDGEIEVNFDATNRSFKDMIADMRCRDVTVDDDILIGEKIGDVKVSISYTEIYDILVEGGGYSTKSAYKVRMLPVTMQETFQPPVLGFSFPGECYQYNTKEAEPDPDSKKATSTYPDCNKENNQGTITVKHPHVKESYINVSEPYPNKPYCNSRICYAHRAAGKDDNGWTGETTNEIIKAKDRKQSVPEDMSPYWVLDADRPASGICFYVAYFLERLFKTLGVAYDMTALTNIEDFNYLAFFNTSCHFDIGESVGLMTSESIINKWLESRGCGGKMNINDNVPEPENYWTSGKRDLSIANGEYASIEKTGSFGMYDNYMSLTQPDGSIRVSLSIGADGRYIHPDQGGDLVYANIFRSFEVDRYMSAHVLRMYANADNFPDASVSEVIESLENSFGVRFCYDPEVNKVTVRLLRDIFRSAEPPIPFKGEVLSMLKKTEGIRGIRFGYSAEQDAREQRDNIRNNKRDYDTAYNYIDYPQGRTQLASYTDLSEKIDVGNRNGYCDLQTGDYFRIKVSADASTTDELQPAIFEVGQYKGVELGDCSEEADRDDAIKEITSQFEPIMVNDVAYRGKNYDGPYTPMLVPFIDEDMEHEFLIKKMLNPVSTKWGSIDIIYELCLAESYDPSSTDDGQSPLMSHEWGLTVGFLRPTRNGGGVYEYERGYDGFDNSKWAVQSKDYAITADTMDVFGTFYGTSGAGSFSLKPRAYKPFRYKYDEGGMLLISTKPQEWDDTWLIPCNADERNAQGVITRRIRSRGMLDTWMLEYVLFLLNRQCYEVKVLCTAAELADISNKWQRRFVIDGKIGWINTIEYPASVQDGIGEVKMEFFSL